MAGALASMARWGDNPFRSAVALKLASRGGRRVEASSPIPGNLCLSLVIQDLRNLSYHYPERPLVWVDFTVLDVCNTED